ncbi:molybdopterin molybdotransferase MoeA [Streptomyces sp. NPDC090023]|uniref:molybdopterin molybdotransferase MoeA n=1 Tax=unclassified Streptomyces TaxID=2593676 RepID=UPI0038267A8A
MTASGTHTGPHAGNGDDLDVEEALALVRGPRADRSDRTHRGDPAAHLEHPHPHPHGHEGATPWPRAREIAARAARRAPRRPVVSVALGDALGLVLAAPLDALSDLPSFDTSAMDGWAVAGPGPWQLRDGGVLAGHAPPEPLTDGEAVRIATGARVPTGVTAVLRSEHGRTAPQDRLHATGEVTHGQDIRPRGQECRRGDQLMPTGTLITPAVLGLAAAAGYDTVTVVPRPRAEILVLGDELLTEGLPHDGLIRDALGPMLAPWLRALGAEVIAVRRLGDDAKALRKAITTSRADLIVTTGGTAAGPVDHVHPTLDRIGAELLVDGVAVRPGHPMLLARTKADQHLVGLPGNPLAAVSGLITLAEPLLRTLAAHPAPEPYAMPLREAVQGHAHDTRLVPVVLRGERAVPLHYSGPAMLRGIATADALAVVPAGGAEQGAGTELLDLPWTTAGIGVCFT